MLKLHFIKVATALCGGVPEVGSCNQRVRRPFCLATYDGNGSYSSDLLEERIERVTLMEQKEIEMYYKHFWKLLNSMSGYIWAKSLEDSLESKSSRRRLNAEKILQKDFSGSKKELEKVASKRQRMVKEDYNIYIQVAEMCEIVDTPELEDLVEALQKRGRLNQVRSKMKESESSRRPVSLKEML